MASDYLAYMRRVNAFVSAGYTWPRIYKYDKEYRRARATMGARWNTDYPHLAEIFSRPGLDGKAKKSEKAEKSNPPTDRKKKSSHCFAFNDHGSCDKGDKCTYEHVCRYCAKPHSGSVCNSAKAKARQGHRAPLGAR